jgi:hypothetical protein
MIIFRGRYKNLDKFTNEMKFLLRKFFLEDTNGNSTILIH